MSEVGLIAATNEPPIVQETTLISIIQRAAADPNVDIDKMERLFEMHQRMESRRAEASYNASMAQAQAELPAVVRNQKNDHTKSKYADLYAIADTALPTINGHGFGLSFSECEATKENCIGIACRASHRDGHSETYKFNIPEDKAGSQGKTNKTDVQAYGSSMTYGRRYATVGVFNIPIKDPDGNEKSEPITEDQTENLKRLLDRDGQDMPGFCLHFQISKLAELPAAKYSNALTMIDRREAEIEKMRKEKAEAVPND